MSPDQVALGRTNARYIGETIDPIALKVVGSRRYRRKAQRPPLAPFRDVLDVVESQRTIAVRRLQESGYDVPKESPIAFLMVVSASIIKTTIGRIPCLAELLKK